MTVHTTNYVDTFIAVAPDTKTVTACAPPVKHVPTVAQIQYAMLADAPYVHTSDDVVHASQGARRGISREEFFATGQACLRASPLVKTYGWGIHHDAEGRVAIYAVESGEYRRLRDRGDLTQRAGLRSSRS
jgi:hypothetical protein